MTEQQNKPTLAGITNMSAVKNQPIRLGLQGPPGSGKTTSALTFPGVLVLDFDHGLQAFAGQDVRTVPFYSSDWIIQYGFKPTSPIGGPNRRDAFLKWLREEAPKLVASDTLVVDSWSTVQDAFDLQTSLEPKYTKEGKIDDYDFWERKIEFSREVMIRLNGLRCNVIVCFHETQIRDAKTGMLLDKIAPLMQGKFVARIKQYFSDYFRCSVETTEVKDASGKVIETKRNYVWQVNSNALFDAKRRSLQTDKLFVPAHYSSLDQTS